MKSTYFGQCSCGINIDRNNNPEETELDTYPSLTLAQTLTLSTGERISGHFTFSRCYDTTIFNFASYEFTKKSGEGSSLDQKSIWNEKSQLHEIDAFIKNKYAGNRSWRK